MTYAETIVPAATARAARGALARARLEVGPQAGPFRVRFFAAEGEASREYADKYGRDWDHFEAVEGAASHADGDVLWLPADIDPARVAGVVTAAVFRGRSIN